MKKSLKFITALLIFCVFAAIFPPVGLAEGGTVHNIPSKTDLYDYLQKSSVEDGDILQCADGVLVAASHGIDDPWIIDKSITIEGGTLTIGTGGILLGADVTFRNTELHFTKPICNAIVANGYTLTLDGVKAGSSGKVFNVFCGTLVPNSKQTFNVPPIGDSNEVIIQGNTNLRSGNTTVVGESNIYAGSLSLGSMSPDTDEAGKSNDFAGNPTIRVEGCANASTPLGTIYAGGAQQRNLYQVDAEKPILRDADQYTVDGTVTIIGTNAVPAVNGEGATATNVVYQGDGNLASKTFEDISSLSVETGQLVLENGSWFRKGGELILGADARLDLKKFASTNLDSIDSYQSDGGFLLLDQNQTWTTDAQVSGTTKIAIDSLSANRENSMKLPKAGHTYISAPNSSAGDFRLLPNLAQPNMTLEKDANGNWIATLPAQAASKLVSLAPENVQVTGEKTEIMIPLNPIYTGTELRLEDLLSVIQINVNGQQAQFTEDLDSPEYSYYTAEGLQLFIGDYGNGKGESFAICNEKDPYNVPVPNGIYTIQITVPGGEHTESGKDVTASCTLTVGDNAPAIKSIPVPTANAGLKWTGNMQTGVNAGTGYTLSGDFQATAVGTYTATAKLETGYQWTGGDTGDKIIRWSIAKADGPAAPSNLSAVAPASENSFDGQIIGTTSGMEYAEKPDFSDALDCGDGSTTGLAAGIYYVRVKETTTCEPGAYTMITVPAAGAPTVTGISVNSTTHKTEYKVGDSLDVTGLTINVAYSDNTTKTISVTADMVGGFDSRQAAESQILTITYEGQTATYAIRITASEQPGDHVHVWESAWNSNVSHHWHDCAASDCTVKDSYAAHTAGGWVVDQPATSTQSGERYRSCIVCGYEMNRETIPATGSKSSSKKRYTTVKNSDGSTTSTSTDRITGTVTETTRRPDGSKTVVETKKDGTIITTDTKKDGSIFKTVAWPDGTTETTSKWADGLTVTVQENLYGDEATVRIPAKLAEESSAGVALPLPPLSGENASITVHTGVKRLLPVEIPIYGNEATTVACLVNDNGSETIVKTAVLSGGKITVSLPDGATVRILDNRKYFQDVQDHWARTAIDFVAARELFFGTSAGTFDPDASMSRAMLMTVLAQLDGADTSGPVYQKSVEWAVAQGISDGGNPDSQVTREQFVAMLHRYAGNPAADQGLRFSDAEHVNIYAQEAIRWAVENGIISGYEDGSFGPQGQTTRAEAATMLTRYVKYLNQL